MSILSEEISNDPTGKGYAAFLPNQPGHVVNLLNAKTEVKFVSPSMVNERTIMTLPPGMSRSILTKFRALAQVDILVEKAVSFLGTQGGLDAGHANTHLLLDQLSQVSGGFTAEEVQALKNLSLAPVSRAEVLGLPFITEEHIRNM